MNSRNNKIQNLPHEISVKKNTSFDAKKIMTGLFDVSKCRHEMEKLMLVKRRSGINHVICMCGKKYG